MNAKERIQKAVFDEGKLITPFNMREGTYTGHCAFSVNFNWKMKLEIEKPKKVKFKIEKWKQIPSNLITKKISLNSGTNNLTKWSPVLRK